MQHIYSQHNEGLSLRLVLPIASTSLMSFSGIVSETAMNVAFPTLMKDLQITTSSVQWLTTGYLLVLALIMPLSSFLKKRFDIRTLFFMAIGLFIIGTLVCIIAPNFTILLLGRLLQGAGTGIALPLMFNIILAITPKSKLGFMMGVASLISSMAPAVGPVLGGFIVGTYGWRMIFVVLLPILMISLILGSKFITPISKPITTQFDKVGYVLLIIGFTAFVYATEQSASVGWVGSTVLELMSIAVLALGIFVWRSIHLSSPLLNLYLFRNNAFSFSLLFILIGQFNVLSLGFLIPNYSQLVSGSSTFIAGLLLLPGCLIGAFIAPIAGRLYDKFGVKPPILTGAILLVIATLLFAIFVKQLTTLITMIFYIVFTVGQGLAIGNSMSFSLSQLNHEQSADGNAIINTLQQLSGAVGTSVAASLIAVEQTTSSSFAETTLQGSQNAFWLLAILAMVALVLIILAFKSHLLKK
ncbi:MDR family MFS transporter [Mannheimia massilioguelmaensis]|uniref:MDR family MFS transporter n=1 Tax=Mannheimia massilioguelmaensis TaxID=1604354 RepID=UPI0005C9AB7C|nr:MDR family MFS transporter [Mannheimia massilioguelmaensis]